MAEPALRLCAEAGLAFEMTERPSSCPAPTRRSTCCSYVRATFRSTCRTVSSIWASRAPISWWRPRRDVVTLAELGFGRCTLEAAVPDDAPPTELDALDGMRVATAYPVSTRRLLGRARGERRSRSRFRLGRSGAAARAVRRDRRPRLDRLDDTANGLRLIGLLLTSQAVLDRRGGGGRAPPRARRPSRSHAARRRRRATPSLPDDERAARRPARDSRRPAKHGRADGAPLANDGEIAVHAAVDADDVWNLLPALKDAGASSILVLPVERLVA